MAAASFIGGNLRKTNNFIFVLAVFGFLVNGVSEDDSTRISLVEGDSVILHTGFEVNQQNRISWYFDDCLIAQISVNTNKNRTDDQFDNCTESIRNRLKLDNQTGSLTIMNMTTADSGDYQLKIFSSSKPREMVFKVTVNGSSAKQEKVKRLSVKEGEDFTLNAFVETNSYDLMTWYFNDTLITGNGNEDTRFSERLKLNHQDGSLTIKNSRISDSGEYLLEINSYRSNNFTIFKTFSVKVTDSFKILKETFIVIGVLMFIVGAFGVMYYLMCYRSSRNAAKKKTKEADLDEEEREKIEEDGETPKSDDRRRSEPDSLELLLTD